VSRSQDNIGNAIGQLMLPETAATDATITTAATNENCLDKDSDSNI
jgi:hypothetical protein